MEYGHSSLPKALWLFALAWRFGISLALAETFLSPSLELEAGYDSNPYRYTEGEGSSYVSAEPALGISWFQSPERELQANVAWRETEYVDDPFSSVRVLGGDAALWHYANRKDMALSMSAGMREDDYEPDEDVAWSGIGAIWKYQETKGVEYTAGANLLGLFYDSRPTESGDAQEDWLISFAPGIQWPVARYAFLWIQLRGEYLASNSDASDYFSGGGSLGIDGEISPRWRCGARADAGVLSYAESTDDVPDQNDYPVQVAAWSTWRARPWLEFLLSLDQTWYGSDGEGDYDRWTARAAARFTGEFKPGDR